MSTNPRDDEGRLYVNAEGIVVAAAYPTGSSHYSLTYGQVEGNARLIAAAPELLDALRALARGAREYPCFCSVAIGKASEHTRVCLNAVAAIAKAEQGRTVASCSWCHTGVELHATVHTYCPTCRHRPDVARVDCTCVRCQLAKGTGGQ